MSRKVAKVLGVTILHAVITVTSIAQDATPSLQLKETPSSTSGADVLESLVTARFSPSVERPLTGQPFTLELIVSLPPGTELAEMPMFPTQWGEFDLREVEEVQRELQSDSTLVYRQKLKVMLWRPRDYNTPETFIGYRLSGYTDVRYVPVRPLSISVPTVLNFNDQTLRPFKPLIDLPYVPPLVIAAGVLIVGGSVSYGYRRWKTRPRRQPLPVPQLSPGETALSALDTIKADDTLSSGERYERVADCLREYLRARYNAEVMTTVETIETLAVYLPRTALDALNKMLTEADLVKFAGVQPDDLVSRRIIDVARHWVIGREQAE